MKKISRVITIGISVFFNCVVLNAQGFNLDFEEWTDVINYIDVDLNREKDTFKIKDATFAYPKGWSKEYSGNGIKRTTDAYSGKYALVLHHWYNIQAGTITYYGKVEKNSKLKNLKGFYKFLEGQVEDSTKKKLGYIEVLLTKYSNGVRDTIATASQWLKPTNSYMSFNLEIKYRSKVQPDSISMQISSGNYWCEYFPFCSYLYVDALKFDLQKKCKIFGLYPNPTQGESYLLTDNECLKESIKSFCVFSLDGKLVKTGSYDAEKLNLEYLPSGFYIIQVRSDNGFIENHKIVKI